MTAQLQPETGTHLSFADVVVPGERVVCTFRYAYDGDRPALRPTLELRLSPRGIFDAESVSVDGAPIAATTMGSILRATLPPLNAGDVVVITFAVLLPRGLANESPVTLTSTVRDGSAAIQLSATARVRAHAAISSASSQVALETTEPLRIGVPSALCVAVVNEGTASTTALALKVLASKDVRIGAMPTIGDVPAGDTRTAVVTIVPTGPKPTVTLEAHYDELVAKLPAFSASALRGPVISGEFAIIGELPPPPTRRTLEVAATVRNSGDIAANVELLIALPDGIALRGEREGLIRLGVVDAGAEVSRAVIFECAEFTRAGSLRAEVLVDGEPQDTILELPLTPAPIASIIVTDFSVDGKAVVGESLLTRLLLLTDGNTAVDEATLDVMFGSGLEFAGDLRVNGAPIAATPAGLALRKVAPGTLIAVTWLTRAVLATPRGTQTAMTACITTPDVVIEASTAAFSVAPAVLTVARVQDLPFTIATDGTMPREAPAAPAAAVPETAPIPEAREDVKTEPSAVSTVEPSAEPAIAPPTAESLRVLRKRLATAAGAASPLLGIIGGLAALADAGTHPASPEFTRAVRALRKANAEATDGLTPAIVTKLRAELRPFAAILPDQQTTLLQGLSAIAESVAASANVDVAWWPSVREYAHAVISALQLDEHTATLVEEDPSTEHGAFADAPHALASLAKAIPAP